MNNRGKLAIALCAGALACAGSIRAQAPARVARIGASMAVAVALVTLASAAGAAEPGVARRSGALMPPSASQEDGLRQGLRDLGYIEGRNVVIEWRRWRSSSTKEDLEALAVDLARSGAEVIVASGSSERRRDRQDV